MTPRRSARCAVAVVAGGAVVAATSVAGAATKDCTTLTNVVYISGSSASKPNILALAKAIGTGVSIIYSSPSACVGLEDVVAAPAQTESSTASYVDPTTSPPSLKTCTGSGGTPYPPVYVDIGISGAYADTCVTPVIVLGSSYADFQGSIESFEISVPWGSSQSSISADAAYVVFGWGGQTYTVSPWNVLANIWTRGDTSGAQDLIGLAIGLNGAKWLSSTGSAGMAQVLTSESTMVTTLATATAYDTTIGILGSGGLDPVKSATGGLKPLALQAANQDCAYYADSDVNHFDKINVRQGRYDIWGPQHFVTLKDGMGNPLPNPAGSANPVVSTQASVEQVVAYFTHSITGDLAFPDASTYALSQSALQSLLSDESKANFIPKCAMQVSRSVELGGESSYQPNQGCGCFFESVTGAGTTLSSYCATCTTSADCKVAAYPACNFGYCEAK
jgi:hypothetical protein